MIKPTPGRIVWFKRGDTRPGEELAAIICKVTNDRLVNLAVFDVHGHPMSRIAVRLLQGDERPGPDCLSWCEWMPYQKGQAAKADVAEAAADAAALDVSALAPRLPAGMTVAEGWRLAGSEEPIANSRPWEPMQSATTLPHGHRQRGSTGQLFEVRNGGWVRVIENPPRPA